MNRSPESMSFGDIVGQTCLLAGLYIASGLIGLQLAVPPGYATIIWPASGIALGALLLSSWRLAGGIFIGSTIVNIYAGQVFDGSTLNMTALGVAVAIACGSTLQATFGYLVIRRIFGSPIALNSLGDIARFLFIAGPISCVIAASIGTASLVWVGFVPQVNWLNNWVTWWTGDFIGIAIFLPIALFSPWHRGAIAWSGKLLPGLTAISLIALTIPLGLTFYGWKWTSEAVY